MTFYYALSLLRLAIVSYDGTFGWYIGFSFQFENLILGVMCEELISYLHFFNLSSISVCYMISGFSIYSCYIHFTVKSAPTTYAQQLFFEFAYFHYYNNFYWYWNQKCYYSKSLTFLFQQTEVVYFNKRKITVNVNNSHNKWKNEQT